MPVKKDLPYIILISKYVAKILAFTKDVTLKEFTNSELIYDACILNIINIAESLKLTSEKFKANNPEIDYRKIIGLRNIAAHSYEGIQPFQLYKIINENIPVLQKQILKILEDEY